MHCCGSPVHDFFANIGQLGPAIAALFSSAVLIVRRIRRPRS